MNRFPEIVNFLQQNIDGFLNRGIGNYLMFCGDFNQLSLINFCITIKISAPLLSNPLVEQTYWTRYWSVKKVAVSSKYLWSHQLGHQITALSSAQLTQGTNLEGCPYAVQAKEARFRFNLPALHVVFFRLS